MPEQNQPEKAASNSRREAASGDEPAEVEQSSVRRWRRVVLLLICVLATAAGLTLWLGREQPATPAARSQNEAPPTQVGVARVEKGDIPESLNGLGTVTPLATVTVKSQISGQITEIKFQEGQAVQKGDLLAVIDTRPYVIALAQSQAQLARDQALLQNAEIDLARFQKLMSQDSIARQQVDTQRFLVSQNRATVQSDQAAVASAKLNLDYCHITAPVGGRVGLRLVDQGNYVQAGDTSGIVVITQIQPITAVFTLPEDDLPAITKRLRAGATLPVAAYDRSMTTKLADGRLSTIDNQIDPTTGTVKLKAEFDNRDESLFPSQFVNARLLVDTLKDVAVAPRAAVLRGAPGDFVYLVKSDDTVAIRKVTLGPADGERIAILDGLKPGDRVVVDGTDRLRDGARVSIAGDTTRAAGKRQRSKNPQAPEAP